MGHPLIPQEQIDHFWQAITDGFTVQQAAYMSGLTYQQGRYVKAKLKASGKQGSVRTFKYAKQRATVLMLINRGVTPHMAAHVVGVSSTTAYNWWKKRQVFPPPPQTDDCTQPAVSGTVPAEPTPDRRPVDRREGLWSRPPRVSVPAPDRHCDDPWTVDWTDD